MRKIRDRVRGVSLLLAATMIVGMGTTAQVKAEVVNSSLVEATEVQTITAMAPTTPTTINVNMAGGCGFTFPTFNGGSATFEDVKNDIALFVKQNDEWVSIDNNSESGWIYDRNFGNFWDGPGGYWFDPVHETTSVKVASKENPNIFVEYTLYVRPTNTQTITAMTPTTPTTLVVNPDAGVGFNFPNFNNGTAFFNDVKDDVALFVKQDDEWVSIDNNADSGWIYNKNFGHFWDGAGGFWFNPVEETTMVKVASMSNPNIAIEYTLQVNDVVRNSYNLSVFDAGKNTFEADRKGAVAIPIPRIDGGIAVKKEIDNFVYEVKVDDEWVNILESSVTGFSYSPNGYNNTSPANQWGYWTDYIFGLWFQPIQEDVELRIGYPLDGEKGGDIGNNYVEYKIIGNPDAPRPDLSQFPDLDLGTSEDPTIEGWELQWNDEFNGTELDQSKWNYETGYYLDDHPDKWGWGNAELQHYTDSKDNVFVDNGYLNIRALEEPKTFPEIDPDRVAPYSSGKITTKDKYKFTYGRIDFSAKLPTGNGVWPALWMLPNDEIYGTWASSGEIDVMEARGRVPGESTGALHFGDTWPGNTHIGGAYTFPEGQTIDSDFHTYSLVWEEDRMSWYTNGKCFYTATKEQWYSAAMPENPFAPFDQDFYIVMNLAMGGWFDGGIAPDESCFPSTMQVDYVRVYKQEEAEIVPVEGVTVDKTTATLNKVGATTKLTATVSPENATNKKITWTSSNPEVATVSATGTVKAVANGTTVITATTQDGEKTAESTITVDILKVPVEGITLDKTSVTLNTKGITTKLTATVTPVDATDKKVTWASSNPEIATVDTNGVVTAVENGKAIITATTVDGEKVAECKVTVEIFELTDDYGICKTTSNSATIYARNVEWSDIHFTVNGTNRQDVRMNQEANNAFFVINNLKEGDVVEYWFTNKPVGADVVDSAKMTYNHEAIDDGNEEEADKNYGVSDITESSIKLFVKSVPWADVHFTINGGGQQNVRMAQEGSDAVYVIENLKENDVVKYWFTYGLSNGGQDGYGEETYTHKTSTEPEEECTKKEKQEVEKVIKEIDRLSNNITLKDKKKVESARESYDDLNDKQKLLVTNYDKLVDAEKKIAELEL